MLSSDQRRAPTGNAGSNRTMSTATTSCMLLTTGMMGQSGCRSSLDPEWIKFHGVHAKIDMEKTPKSRFDTNPSSTFQATQPLERTLASDFSGAKLGEDQVVVLGDGKAAPPCNNLSYPSRQEVATSCRDAKAPPAITRLSTSQPLPENIPPTYPSPHSTFTSSHATTDIHSNCTVAGLEDSTLPSHSCLSNHADSYGPTVQPPGDYILHHMSTTNTNAIDSHDEAIEVTNKFSHAMLPRMREENPLQPLAIYSETRAEDEAWIFRKRSGSPAQDAVDIDGGHCSRTALPMGLRNKKMKPTDCLLYAATLLSKVDAAAAQSQRTTIVPKQATTMDTACNASSDDPNQPRDVDVLCGRGGLINKHPGNIVYRKVVDYNKSYYQSVHKKHRILVSQSIVQSILNFGGRFLTLGAKNKTWMEIGYKRAVQKTSQALRERSVAQSEDDDDDEEEEDTTTDDKASYGKKKGSADNQERLDKFRWDARTNLKKNAEMLKGS